MGGWKRARWVASVPEAPHVDAGELVPELRDLFSEYPAVCGVR
jgi:hypothetical protein